MFWNKKKFFLAIVTFFGFQAFSVKLTALTANENQYRMFFYKPEDKDYGKYIWPKETKEWLDFVSKTWLNDSQQNNKSILLEGSKDNGRKKWIYTLAQKINACVLEIDCISLIALTPPSIASVINGVFITGLTKWLKDQIKVIILFDNLDILCLKNYPTAQMCTQELINGIQRLNHMQFEVEDFAKLELDDALVESRDGLEEKSISTKSPIKPEIFVVATAEHAQALDSSLFSYKALGITVPIDYPDLEARSAFLTKKVAEEQSRQKIEIESEEILKLFAEKTDGFSFENLVSLVRGAFLLAKKDGVDKVIETHFHESLVKVCSQAGIDLPKFSSVETAEKIELGFGDSLNGEKSSFRINLFRPGGIKTTFSDVVADNNVKAQLTDIMEFLKNSSKFKKLGAEIPRGVLLHGPPGTGKTLSARAVAGECGCAFIHVNASQIVSKYLGESAKNMGLLFQTARKVSKEYGACIIFFDEIDSIAGKRGMSFGSCDDNNRQILNQLLNEMDGFEKSKDSPEKIIVIGATNQYGILDRALLRPGRFERIVFMGLPARNNRLDMINLLAKEYPIAKDVDHNMLATRTVGFSYASLRSLFNEGAIAAAKDDMDEITSKYIEEAFYVKSLGLPDRSKKLSEKELLITAYHEAGHALGHFFYPGARPLKSLTCLPRGHSLGATYSNWDSDKYSYSQEELFAEIVCLFGGRVAEEIAFGIKSRTTGASEDIERATSIALDMVARYGMSSLGAFYLSEKDATSDSKVKAKVLEILEEAKKECYELLTNKIAYLHLLSRELFKAERLDIDQIKELFADEESLKKNQPAEQIENRAE